MFTFITKLVGYKINSKYGTDFIMYSFNYFNNLIDIFFIKSKSYNDYHNVINIVHNYKIIIDLSISIRKYEFAEIENLRMIQARKNKLK